MIDFTYAGMENSLETDRQFRVVEENPDVLSPVALSTIFSHGEKTQDVYILFHGFTNAPPQFHAFGKKLFATGANVILPRLPYHGHRDRMTTALAHLTEQDLINSASKAIFVAHQMGRRVIFVGLSISGVTAAWVAQNRPDVDTSVLLAPFFGASFVPNILTRPSASLFALLPNIFRWWNMQERENLRGSPHAYPRFSTHALAQVIQLGNHVLDQAQHAPPRVRQIIVVTVPNDPAVNNVRTQQLLTLWEQSGISSLQHDVFPEAWETPHDFIDPWAPDQQIDRVYPQLLEWLETGIPGT